MPLGTPHLHNNISQAAAVSTLGSAAVCPRTSVSCPNSQSLSMHSLDPVSSVLSLLLHHAEKVKCREKTVVHCNNKLMITVIAEKTGHLTECGGTDTVCIFYRNPI